MTESPWVAWVFLLRLKGLGGETTDSETTDSKTTDSETTDSETINGNRDPIPLPKYHR